MAGHPPKREPVSVLLAEHEPEVAEMSARYLRQDGLRVRLVTSPEPTLAELTGGPDAAAVIDLTMPGLDPRRIRRALRTPVIFLVADAKAPRPRGLAVRGDAAGARRWLARPFSPRQLVSLVRDVLAGGADSSPPGPPADRILAGLRLDGLSRTAMAVVTSPDRHRVRGARRMLDNPAGSCPDASCSPPPAATPQATGPPTSISPSSAPSSAPPPRSGPSAARATPWIRQPGARPD